MNNCKNCDKELTGEFCSGCGFPNKLKRIDGEYIVNEISGAISFDKGIFYTIKELLIRPGYTVRGFIFENRKRLAKPILFLIICSIVYTITQQFLNFEAGWIKINASGQEAHIITEMYNWFSENYGYTNILIAIPLTFWIKIFFKKYKYNYYEIYILLCFTMGISMLIYSLFGIVESIINYSVLQFGLILGFIYSTWAIGQFFDGKKKLNYLKGFLSYLFGIVSSLIIFGLIGGINMMIKAAENV